MYCLNRFWVCRSVLRSVFTSLLYWSFAWGQVQLWRNWGTNTLIANLLSFWPDGQDCWRVREGSRRGVNQGRGSPVYAEIPMSLAGLRIVHVGDRLKAMCTESWTAAHSRQGRVYSLSWNKLIACSNKTPTVLGKEYDNSVSSQYNIQNTLDIIYPSLVYEESGKRDHFRRAKTTGPNAKMTQVFVFSKKCIIYFYK